jgi:hypothetical protein
VTGAIENPDRRPWYREFWPWLLMLPPALSVVGGVAMLFLAIETPSALVVDDYARIEELTSERFDRDREALRLGLTAELEIEREAGHVELFLAAPPSYELPDVLILVLRHATNPAADLELSLAREGDRFGSDAGHFGADAGRPGAEAEHFGADAELDTGIYYVELMDPERTWRLSAGARWLDGRIGLEPQADGP